jgi:hypothetical protein
MVFDPFPQLTTFLGGIEGWLFALGGTLMIISIAFAAIIRLPIFGVSERRTMLSNAALGAILAAAIIMGLAIPAEHAWQTLFPTRPPVGTPIVVPSPTGGGSNFGQ